VNSLSAHLTAGRDHGRLRFHLDCPVCRDQRLAGTLSDPVLSTRTTAGLLAAALGAGTLVPSSVATASDAGKPPTAKASPAPPPAPPPAPEAREVPATEEPALGVDETQEMPVDEAPELRELLTSPDAGTDAQGEDVSEGVEENAPAPAPPEQAPVEPPVEPASAPLEVAPPEQAPVDPPPPAPPTAPTPAPQSAPPAREQSPVAEPDERHPAGPRTRRSRPQPRLKPRQPAPQAVTESEPAPRAVTEPERARQPTPAPPSVDAVAPAESTASVTVSQPVQAPWPRSGSITGRFYTVRPGDSLWSIARRLLGPGASAGQIAREVNRLWELNRERIGTGNPSLIHVGTVLRLR
jgi:hypothetical protein